MLIIGIDPSSGASSPVGIAILDGETRELLLLDEISTDKKLSAHRRIVDLHDQLATLLIALDPNEQTFVYMETFVMQGRNGQLLANASGALMAAVPSWCEFDVITNTTVKKLVGGTGKADKTQVGAGCLMMFLNTPAEATIRAAINAGQWDRLDALAIALAGDQRRRQLG